MRNISTGSLGLPLKTLLALLLAALLAGCGMARMAYNNGESLSYFWLNRYVDFTDQQRPWVEDEIDAVFAWHRRTQLSGYVDLLQKAQQRVHQPAIETDIRADAQAVRSRVLLVIDRALPGFAELALSLQPEQLVHLEKKFASNNDDYRRDNLRGDLEKRQRDRFKKTLKQAEYFFGNLNGQQEQRLRQISDARPLNNELVLRDRQRRQQEMLMLLRRIQTEKPPKEVVVKMLRDYVQAAQDHFGNAEHKAFYQAYEAASIRQITEIINMSTPDQKQHFIDTLQHWINDFRRLANPGQRHAPASS